MGSFAVNDARAVSSSVADHFGSPRTRDLGCRPGRVGLTKAPCSVPAQGSSQRRGSHDSGGKTLNEDVQEQLAAQAAELAEIQEQATDLEAEVVALRRRLQDAPKRVRTLEERLLETKGQLQQAVSQNEKLTYTLREARDHIR